MRIFFRIFRVQNLFNVAIIIFILYFIKTALDILSPSNESPPSVNQLPELEQFFADYEHSKLTSIHKLPEKNVSYFKPKSIEKVDWHNYTQIEMESKREGIGEQGKPAKLPVTDATVERILYDVNGYNGALSDKIPLNRSLPDIRHKGCMKKHYVKDLPDVSVVVPFHNEHFSTLVRTAFSVMLRSPEHLVREIFLVDDASTKVELKKKLDVYLAKHLPKVKVLRLRRRSGLIAARLAGAKKAEGAVLIFLDAHTEANVNWLPPLLEPIALDYRTAVCPFIDVVAYDTFEYRAQDEGARGAFDWEFFYKRLPVLPKDLKNMPEPFESPVMAGGLFAISRYFFWELGGYDPGLDIWGGEQYELSFKIWQCGGRLIDAPCSRVGHIYRKFAPFPNPGHGDFVGKNYRRVADVWMDEYAKYLYRRRPQYLTIEPGDISQQKAIRTKLKCKPFRWFMTQIAFDLTAKYPVVEPKPYAEGRIRPVLDDTMCVNMRNRGEMERLLITSCHDHEAEIQFALSWHKDIRSKKRSTCWDVPDAAPGGHVLLYGCHGEAGNQLWRYQPKTQQLKWGGESKCLTYKPIESEVVIDYCDEKDKAQRWLIDVVHEDLLKNWRSFVKRVTGPVEKWP